MRRRPVRIVLVLASVLLVVVAWSLLSPRHTATLPFTYSAAQGTVRIRAGIAGTTRSLGFNSLLTKSVLGHRIYQQLVKAEVGIDRLNPSTDLVLGSYRTRVTYAEIAEEELQPQIDGVLGIDPFVPSAGFEGKNGRPGARLTLDFKAGLLKLEDAPHLTPLKLPKGTIQVPLRRDGDGPYYLLLPLNNGTAYPFALGIGCRDVILPTGAVLFPDPEGIAYIDATGVVPVTLTLGGQDLSVQAVAAPGIRTTGVLGMSLLANYRVVIDFRNNRLYLEPSDSPSDL